MNSVRTHLVDLEAVATNIKRLEFSPGRNARVDDQVINVATNFGPLPPVHLNLLATNLYIGRLPPVNVAAITSMPAM